MYVHLSMTYPSFNTILFYKLIVIFECKRPHEIYLVKFLSFYDKIESYS